MPKPADFYVGALDVFSILLPGAVVSWTAWLWFGGATSLGQFMPRGDTANWVAFVLAAFAAGHIVFMLASLIDITFDRFRKHVLWPTSGKYRQAVERNALEAASALRLVSLAAEPLSNKQPVSIFKIRSEAWARAMLGKPENVPTITEPTNTYQWSRAVLRLRAPTALSEVLRLEADSKFFRSLFVVFSFLAICSMIRLPGSEKLPLSMALLMPLAALSYWRYAEQRQKAIAEAYRSVIVLFAIGAAAPPAPESMREENADLTADAGNARDDSGDSTSALAADLVGV